ncbi:AAA family ATPase [Allobaculum sp. Allo2]|nr:AAA family ATPase [Allobaculum sp. Allo2]
MIVDEFSMVDTRLFSALLKAMPANTRLLIIGDEEQLESVGEGKVLSDLIASKEFPTIHLDQLYRQKKAAASQNCRMKFARAALRIFGWRRTLRA